MVTSLVSLPNVPAAAPTSFSHDHVAAFPLQLRPRVRDEIVRLRRKSHDQRRPARIAPCDGGEDVGVLGQLERRRPLPILFELCRRRLCDAPIGDGGGGDEEVGRERGLDRRQHLARRLDAPHHHPRRIGQRDGARHQHHLGAGGGGGDGQRVALLAG